jgi:hypothetical protein
MEDKNDLDNLEYSPRGIFLEMIGMLKSLDIKSDSGRNMISHMMAEVFRIMFMNEPAEDVKEDKENTVPPQMPLSEISAMSQNVNSNSIASCFTSNAPDLTTMLCSVKKPKR